MSEVKYYTEAEWINKKPSTIGSWTVKGMDQYRVKSGIKSGRTKKVQNLLKKLAKAGIK